MQKTNLKGQKKTLFPLCIVMWPVLVNTAMSYSSSLNIQTFYSDREGCAVHSFLNMVKL